MPDRVVTNEELAATVATTPKWVEENLGIRERRIASRDERTSDLAVRAATAALESAGLQPNDIGMIIVATATPDRQAPSTACIVQQKLGVTNLCPAFDLSAVCSGFLYGMAIAGQFLESGTHENVLVIGADTFSRITDWSRRDCVFFGDGAGAAVLSRDPSGLGFFGSMLHADGSGQDNFTVYPGDPYFTMNGRAVYEAGSRAIPDALISILRREGLSPEDIALLVPHQPSIRMLRTAAAAAGIPFDRVATNMDKYANTSGATIPLLLDEVRRGGRVRPGDLVAFAAVGSGWTWGAALYRWL